MPIYEYRCGKCGRVLSFLVRSIAAHKPPACPKCGHPKMSRAISRFSPVTGAKAAAAPDAVAPAAADDMGGAPPGGAEVPGGDDMPDLSMLDGVDEKDPRSMGRALRQMAGQTGEPLDEEMEEVVRRLESGEDPDAIDEKLGGPGGDDSASGPADDTLYDA